MNRKSARVYILYILIFFTVVAGIAGYVNNKPITPTGAHVEKILPLLPSIFPIVFAALMGKLFKHFALYRAERGVTLLVRHEFAPWFIPFLSQLLTFIQGIGKACGLPVSFRGC